MSGLVAASLDSTSLANPIAWEMVVGRRMAISFLMSGRKPEIKQFRIAGRVRSSTLLQSFSNSF